MTDAVFPGSVARKLPWHIVEQYFVVGIVCAERLNYTVREWKGNPRLKSLVTAQNVYYPEGEGLALILELEWESIPHFRLGAAPGNSQEVTWKK